ncbi:type I restriction-modification system subunit M [Dubosiella newyorkensis]|uniref:site-specific DNA-methyltransferase (adenine-specific) n=2 Tax=Dubosiella newyorkensis TaxID=1862672 RepID=A0A1U7NMH8_9FIRM|nr:type I restriction-modification system subunit M [Dubosiella newyorkensis]OLU46403.1 type I restriction-modification system subunit M [Dubosiella newyorkensis]
MNKQQLAAKIWESANQMRSKIEASEYKDYILGFIFYKYLSEQELKLLINDGWDEETLPLVTEEDQETVRYIQDRLGYFISYPNLFSTWIEHEKEFDVSNVREALSAFSRLISNTHRDVFDGIFETLETGLSKLGDSAQSQTKAIINLLQLIKDIPMDSKQDYDVLGFVYEYLIGMFAANAGKKAGEFYTPHEVSVLMSDLVANHLKDRKEIKIYDPTSGSGSLLLNIGESASRYLESKDRIQYYAQELKRNTYNLTRMNLIMRGIKPSNIFTRNADTLEDDWPPNETKLGMPLYVDAVVSNPPYSQKWDPEGKRNDPRYRRYGVAPKTKADYAFLLHDLYHIKPDGIMAIVLPHGVLFRGGEEGEIRKNLIENNNIDTIIGLPANIFYGTSIPTIIMLLRQKRENNDVLIVDSSKYFEKSGKSNVLRASDIKRIRDVVVSRKTIDKFSRTVSLEEIRANDYNLNIPRYVDSSEPTETWDLYASMYGGIPKSELSRFDVYWKNFPNLKKKLFNEKNDSYVSVKGNDLKQIFEEDSDIHSFKKAFYKESNSFESDLKQRLIEGMMEVDLNREEDDLGNLLFHKLKEFSLIDRYEAYQILDNHWKVILGDLENIQNESERALTKVDPNLVMKKKNGKDVETQEGWKGHIIPFELVERRYFTEEFKKIEQLEQHIYQIDNEIQEILENLDEEEKENLANEEGTQFVTSNLTNRIKELKKDKDDDELLKKLNEANKLLKEQKAIQKEIKTSKENIHAMTKDKLESLSIEEAKALVYEKWISPLMDQLIQIPQNVMEKLKKQLEQLEDKYSETLNDLDDQIHQTEQELAKMIDDLTGNEYDMKGLEAFKSLLGY